MVTPTSTQCCHLPTLWTHHHLLLLLLLVLVLLLFC
jgi:hypothetical protein